MQRIYSSTVSILSTENSVCVGLITRDQVHEVLERGRATMGSSAAQVSGCQLGNSNTSYTSRTRETARRIYLTFGILKTLTVRDLLT